MKQITIYIIAIIVFCSMISCKPSEGISQEQIRFMEKSQLGVYENGNDIYIFNNYAHQLGYDPIDKTFFRIQDDNQNGYCHIDFKNRTAVQVGQTLEIVVTTKTVNIENRTYNVEVVKVQDEKVWLWNGEKNIGFITM